MACFVGLLKDIASSPKRLEPSTCAKPTPSSDHIRTNIVSLNRSLKQRLGPFGKGGEVSGFTEIGWASVRSHFEANFANNMELGAQLVIYQGEKKVVDLCGHSSKQITYTPETLQCVYSCGKNMEAIVVAMLADRGLLKHSDRVVEHWPEFGDFGKDKITVADVMRHEGGLAVFADHADTQDGKKDRKVTPEIVQDIEKLCELVAGSPLFEEGKRCYHAITRGFVVSCIVHKVDPQKRTIGQFIKDEITDKFENCTYFCGLPEEEQGKYSFADMTQIPGCWNLCFEFIPAMRGKGDPPLMKAIELFGDKNCRSPVVRPAVSWGHQMPAFNNTKKGRSFEICSAGCAANARSMAMINACLANGGQLGGVRLMSAIGCEKLFSKAEYAWDTGIFMGSEFTESGLCKFGETTKSEMSPGDPGKLFRGFYGWGGWGGSMSVINPEHKLSVAYTMNGMSNYLFGGPRLEGIFTEIHEILSSGACSEHGCGKHKVA